MLTSCQGKNPTEIAEYEKGNVMEKYVITGMSCAACQVRVEKAVNSLKGVTECTVNLLTNSMTVEGNVLTSDIIKAVEDAGYGATLLDEESQKNEEEEALKDKETPILKRRLLYSVGFLLVLIYFSMGHKIFGFPLPPFLDGNVIAIGIIQMILCIVIMIINRNFFISGFRGLMHKSPNMDTLVALGSSASFVYSAFALAIMMISKANGAPEKTNLFYDELYFESAAMILTFITVGKMLEARSKGKTTTAIKSLMKLVSKTATVIDENGAEKEVPIEQVKVEDIFVVKAGERIPVDGVIVEGSSAIDESSLTGESIPVDKNVGEDVFAATINSSGYLKCKATRVGKDTTLSQIITMVSDAAATKAPIAKLADKVSGVFVPVVMCIALVTIMSWLIVGASFGYALARGVAVLVISCPCALGLATPVAVMVGNGVGAKNGILFKTAATLENAGKCNIVILDKTGTITKGEPVVTDVFLAEAITESGYSAEENLNAELEFVRLAGILEAKSNHPLARAVATHAVNLCADMDVPVDDFSEISGNGLEGTIEGAVIRCGNLDFISKYANIPEEVSKRAYGLSIRGKTPLFFAKDNIFVGIIAVADTIKDDSAQAIEELKNMGIRVVMMTGDNENTARAIAAKAGINEVYAGVLPGGKKDIADELMKQGKVVMVGDGINDAPALTAADVGIAIGAGTDVAVDAADIVLMRNSLLDVSGAIRLSKGTLANIRRNLFWAFIYNVIGIPIAAGCFIELFGLKLSPMFGAAAMSLSSFFVVTNALGLNLFDIRDASKDKKMYNKIKKHKTDDEDDDSDNEIIVSSLSKTEEINMTKTLSIEGMMCGHCENTVKAALEAVEGVTEAVVSHEKNTAVVTLNLEVSDDILKKAVEEKDYKVIEIK